MRPFVTEQSCLNCHEQQGYQVGDIRGGISLSVPMAPYTTLAGEQTTQLIAGHGGLWALGLIGIFFATHRIRGQQSDLSHERDQYQSLVENIPGITYSCAWDKHWTVIYMSRQVEQLSGYPASDFIGNAVRTFASVIHPDDAESVWHGVEEAIASSERWELEYRVCHRDGTIRWVYEKGRAVLDAHGKVKFLDGFILDITGRIEAERQLREATRSAEAASVAKSQFLATMSHEIRTPMNAVLGMADLLEMTSLDETQREYLRHIKGGGDVLLSVIGDILDYSAIESGRLSIEAIPICPAAIIEKVTAVFETKARGKGVSLRSEFAESLPAEIIGDPTRLQQILFNLIGNALKFTERGWILVKAYVDKPKQDEGFWMRIDVSDTGVGITPVQLERLFEPFTQADNTITRRFGGSGLGLSICKRLAELMGGRIEVTSQLGKGSTFSLLLPIKTSKAS
jgi:PAS domain S-box-containing protein